MQERSMHTLNKDTGSNATRNNPETLAYMHSVHQGTRNSCRTLARRNTHLSGTTPVTFWVIFHARQRHLLSGSI
jgi:hypothetical protein